MFNSQRGFTLIEMVVVVGIIALLAAVIAPTVSGFIGSGKQGAIAQETENVQTALTAMMADLSVPQGSLDANDLSTSGTATADWTANPTGGGAAPLADYLEAQTTAYFYCFDTNGRITEVFEQAQACTK